MTLHADATALYRRNRRRYLAQQRDIVPILAAARRRHHLPLEIEITGSRVQVTRLQPAFAHTPPWKAETRAMSDWLVEQAPYRLGDTVWLVKDVFGIGLNTPGLVIKCDIPVARAYQVGMDSCGIVEVEFAAANRRVQSHWTNFIANPPSGVHED